MSSLMPIHNIFSMNYYYYVVSTISLLIGIDTKKIHAFFFSHFNSQSNDDTEKRFAPKPDRIEVGTVLKALGIASCGITSIEADDVLALFDEKNPSLDEVREAFDVFDDNKDGVIDAEEVQRVLRALGVNHGSSVEECRRMIAVHDCNRDGVLDFDEFVKFMETVSC